MNLDILIIALRLEVVQVWHIQANYFIKLWHQMAAREKQKTIYNKNTFVEGKSIKPGVPVAGWRVWFLIITFVRWCVCVCVCVCVRPQGHKLLVA